MSDEPGERQETATPGRVRRVLALVLARGVAVALLPTLLVGAIFNFYAPGVGAYGNALVFGASIAGVTAACAAVEVLLPRRRPGDDVLAAIGCALVGGLAALAIAAQVDYAGVVLSGRAGPLDAAALSIAPSWRGALLGTSAGVVLGVGALQRRRGHGHLAVLGGSALAAYGAIITLFVLDARPRLGVVLEALVVAVVPGGLLGLYVAGVTATVDELLGGAVRSSPPAEGA